MVDDIGEMTFDVLLEVEDGSAAAGMMMHDGCLSKVSVSCDLETRHGARRRTLGSAARPSHSWAEGFESRSSGKREIPSEAA